MSKSHKLLFISTSIFLSSCSMNEGDPQVTLCQLLAAQINQTEKVEWAEAEKVQIQDKSMQVTIHSASSSPAKINAVCVYLSDAEDAGQDYEFKVEDGYQSVPDSMSINGRGIKTPALHMAIQKVTGQSVKDTLNKVR